MNRIAIFTVMTALTLAFSGCHPGKKVADLMLFNGVIYTVDDEFTTAECMVITDGKVVAVGDHATLVKRYQATEVVDLQGAVVYPGFYDPHCHFYHYGAGLATRADLSSATSYQEVIQIMQQFANDHTAGWLAGRGWDQNRWPEKAFPDNSELNKLWPDRPVVLIRVDGHAVIANDMALKMCGLSATSRIEGGEIHLRNGKPTGVLIDKAADIVKDRFLAETTAGSEGEEVLIKGILLGQENCFKVGLTSVGDAGLKFNELQLLERLQEQGLLKMSVYAMLDYSPENIQYYIKKGGYKNGRIHVRSVKFYADGALGSRGALLMQPYSDMPDSYGLLTLNIDTFRRQCEAIRDAGYQVNTHAIGDSANRLVLQVYASVLTPGNDLRWRIEHAQVVHPDDLELFMRCNIIPAINTTHATSDMGWVRSGFLTLTHTALFLKPTAGSPTEAIFRWSRSTRCWGSMPPSRARIFRGNLAEGGSLSSDCHVRKRCVP
jgi:predicted amidohydrolase YtcJ